MLANAGVLYNAVAWTLAKDVILNGGPSRLDRIDLPTVSMQPMTPGLTLLDVDITLGLNPVAGANIPKFLSKCFVEPAAPAHTAAESATMSPADPLTAHQ